MTTIDFYTHVPDRLEVAARIIAKAHAAHGSVRVLTPDAAMTDALDRRLWLLPPTGFIPHCRTREMMTVCSVNKMIYASASEGITTR